MRTTRWGASVAACAVLAGVLAAPAAADPVGPTDASTPDSGAAASAPAVVPGEVLVTWRSDLGADSRRWLRDRYDLRRLAPVRGTAAEQVELPSDVSVDDAVAVLADDPRVAAVQPNYRYARQSDTFYGELWGLNNTGQSVRGISGIPNVDIDAPQAWAVTQGSSSVVVAVIDTGVQIAHPDLNDNIWLNTDEVAGDSIDNDGNGFVDDVRGWDFYSGNASVYDGENCGGFNNDDHGTHVAGTIAAERNTFGVAGVAPSTRLMVLKTIGCDGGDTAGVSAAVTYAAANGARIANMSLGGPGSDPVLKSAIDAAGILVVAAAGNGDVGGPTTRCWLDGGDPVAECPMYPAAFSSSSIVSVAAVTSRGSLAGFSQYGTTGPNGTSTTGVDLGAPGQDVLSTFPDGYGAGAGAGYAYLSGTSMAAPHVSGVAALILAQNPTFTTAQLKQRLLDRGRPLTSLAGRTVTGRMVDAAGALGVTKLALAFSASPVTYGYGVTVKATLTAGSGVGGRTLELRRYVPSTNSWVVDCTVTTASDGTASCYRKPTSGTTYEWRFAGAPGFLDAWSGRAFLAVKARVGLSVTDTTPRRGQTVTFTTTVKPNHPGATVALQRWTGSAWTTVRTASLWSTSQRTFTITPSQSGTTYWRARFNGDADHAANSSSTVTLRTS